MWSAVVVLQSPLRAQHPGLRETREQFTVQQFIAHTMAISMESETGSPWMMPAGNKFCRWRAAFPGFGATIEPPIRIASEWSGC
jgi:hypothetical protein